VVDTDAEVIEKFKNIVTEDEIKALYNLGKLEFHDALHDLVESVAEKLGIRQRNKYSKDGRYR
jgi:hypothetical protein